MIRLSPSASLVKFAYEDLSERQFEILVTFLCQEILGIAVQDFAEGPDGGRDAKFVGVAQLHPSTTFPWRGTTIIQAKHSNGFNRSFSEGDFFSLKTAKSIVTDEAPRVKRLRDEGGLDHYMLFSNRRLTAGTNEAICKYISEECSIPPTSVYLCGFEQLERWLKKFPDVASRADLDFVDSPLLLSPNDLATVIEALAQSSSSIKHVLDTPPTPRLSFERKNEINNMSAVFAKELRKRFLRDTNMIQTFLAAPENMELLKLYESIVEEFQLSITAKRKDYQTFDEVFDYVLRLLFDRDPVLRQVEHKRLTRSMLFYMYWNCDIGLIEDVTT